MPEPRGIGHILAPWRFITFLLVAIAAGVAALPLGDAQAVMVGFDSGALAFLVICVPLLRDEAEAMRAAARRNDANRALLLAISGAVMVAVLVAVASILIEHGAPAPGEIALIVATLILSWLFSNMVYTLHYAHMYYTQAEGGDAGGVGFPDTDEPDYWDFLYFAFCLGMTFQVSDTELRSGRFRRVVTVHSLAAFVFNIGVIAFAINVLGGAG